MVTTGTTREDLGIRHPAGAFDDWVDRRYLTPAYQPIFDLATGEQVAAEALARWPALGLTPDAAFRWAAEHDQLSELDRACRNAAIDDAVAHGLGPQFDLFVNLEPSALEPGTASALLARADERIGLVAEITERALLRRPAELLRAVAMLRAAGCGIALDDVGADPDSLALLPFIAPDVIKLDLSLVQRWLDVGQAAIYTAVAAYAERTGATVLAEGIETEEDLAQALALGATLGQGWYLAHPGPLDRLTGARRGRELRRPLRPRPRSPFALVDPGSMRTGTKGLLLDISRHLENQGLALESPAVVLGAFQEAGRFTPLTASRYAHLASRCSLVVALGADLPPEPVPGVRGVALSDGDALRDEWTVAVVGTHYAGALIAKDLGESGPDRDRRYAFILTHHHETVLAAARSLLGRVVDPDMRY
jgi:EAL domain-containing protein (putative c-di-GMP-specific phosphodiesterase class I)